MPQFLWKWTGSKATIKERVIMAKERIKVVAKAGGTMFGALAVVVVKDEDVDSKEAARKARAKVRAKEKEKTRDTKEESLKGRTKEDVSTVVILITSAEIVPEVVEEQQQPVQPQQGQTRGQDQQQYFRQSTPGTQTTQTTYQGSDTSSSSTVRRVFHLGLVPGTGSVNMVTDLFYEWLEGEVNDDGTPT